MSIQTVLAHLAPIARQLRASILPGGGDPAAVFNAMVEAAYLVAVADGVVDDTEMVTLIAAVQSLTDGEMTRAEVTQLMDDLVDLRKAMGTPARCRSIGETLREGSAAEEGLYLAAAIAYVSGGLSEPELAVLEKVARASHVSGAVLATIATSVRDELARHSTIPAAKVGG